MRRRLAAHRASAGFGLVETMVALVIGLLATFIIMHVFATSEAMKRTTTGGADAQSDAAIALYMMERDLRQAGYGLSPNPEDFVPPFTPPQQNKSVLTNGILAQCRTVSAYNKNRTGNPDFKYLQDTFAPVVINPPNIPPGDANTAVILVNYSAAGGMIGRGIPLLDQTATGQSGGDIPDYAADKDVTRAGFMQGDMILAVPLAANPPPECTLGEITGLPVPAPPANCQCAAGCVTGANNLINHNDVQQYSSVYKGCGTADAVWNKAGVAYNAGSRLYNLGPVGAFVSRVYAVRNGNLTMCDLTDRDCTDQNKATSADGSVWKRATANVVGLKAQYGKDSDFDGKVDVNGWNTDQPTGAARAQVIAIRLALVIRSGQYEKQEVTQAAPKWRADASDTTDNVDLFDPATLRVDPDNWKHYRYKAAQSVVPLRNMIWGEQSEK